MKQHLELSVLVELKCRVHIKRIIDKSVGEEYITGGFNNLGFHVMQSLRDTEKQLIVEVN